MTFDEISNDSQIAWNLNHDQSIKLTVFCKKKIL
jgi:hypothetical protein